MDTIVKVLVEGYAKEVKRGWIASSTTTLIKESGKNVLVDPGKNKNLLLKRLEIENLAIDNIDVVFISHYDPDHVFLASIFNKASVVDGSTVYRNDKETEYNGNIPGTSIKVITTPGHTSEHCSLVVGTGIGIVAIAADVFWWTNKENQEVKSIRSLIYKKDPFAQDQIALVNSRKKVLSIADWIIPGHGRMFKNPTKPLE